jgi:hypothetical protein
VNAISPSRHASTGPRQGAEAEVDAVTEAEVLVRLARQIEPVRVGEDGRVAVRGRRSGNSVGSKPTRLLASVWHTEATVDYPGRFTGHADARSWYRVEGELPTTSRGDHADDMYALFDA